MPQHHSALAFSWTANVGAWLHPSSPTPGPPVPIPSTENTHRSSREAQDFAPLMCNKKGNPPELDKKPHKQEPQTWHPPPWLPLSWAACVGYSERFSSPRAKELLAAAGLLCWHEVTDVSLHLCAHQLNKQSQQQHGVTVLMEGPPALGSSTRSYPKGVYSTH